MERVHLVFFNHKIIVVVGKKLVRLRHILIAEMKEVSYSFGSLIIFKKNNRHSVCTGMTVIFED